MVVAFFSLLRILGEHSTISCLRFFFFFKVEISSRTLIPLFMPVSAHSGSLFPEGRQLLPFGFSPRSIQLDSTYEIVFTFLFFLFFFNHTFYLQLVFHLFHQPLISFNYLADLFNKYANIRQICKYNSVKVTYGKDFHTVYIGSLHIIRSLLMVLYVHINLLRLMKDGGNWRDSNVT